MSALSSTARRPACLPAHVVCRKPYRGIHPPEVLSWDGQRRGFFSRDGRSPAPASFIYLHLRDGVFAPVGPGQMEML